MNLSANSICPCCASHELRFLGKLPDSKWFAGKGLDKPLLGGALYYCCRCNLKFRYPLHDATTYDELYDNSAISAWSGTADRPDWNLIINHIFRRFPQGGRVLDFGCYTAELLKRLGTSYERHGVEINNAAATVATDRQLACVWPTIGDIPGGLRFDAVIMSDVIEHMPNPGRLIDDLLAVLADNGVLIITTGDAESSLWNRFGANWWYCFYPEHISFISRAWLDRFCTSRGLFIEQCDRFSYLHLSRGRRISAILLTYIYGYFPSLYLRLSNTLRRVLKRPAMTNAPGNGVSADHLFIVLVRNGKQS